MKASFDAQLFGLRVRGASIFVICLFSLLLLRLWYLQVITGDYYRSKSENQRTQTIRTAAPRGNIFDREGRALVKNRAAFDIALLVESVPDIRSTIELLAQITGRDLTELETQFRAESGRPPFEPKVLMADVSFAELAKVKVNSYRLPGVIVNVNPKRTYPEHTLAAKVVGYVREIEREQLQQLAGREYRMGDLIGQTGVEDQYEDVLRGRAGYIEVEADARGNRRRELGIVDDISGNDLYLTIDLDLQREAELALGEEKGAVVGIDPRNGEVLVLASAPSYDANIFSGAVSQQDWKLVAQDKRRPLLNRAIAAHYAPGSTFKLAMAVAALATKIISPEQELACPGYYQFGRRRYRCHKRTGHGMVDLRLAVVVSCDSYFYQLGQRLKISAIHDFATMMGLGTVTGIDLPEEGQGLVPSEDWKLRRHGERWYPGETLSVSIGQGYLNTTPLQMAVLISALANDGTVFKPIVARKSVNTRTGEERDFVAQGKKIPVDSSILAKVRSYAVDVVSDPRGTGHRAAIPGIVVGGKTGTSQVISLDRQESAKEFQDHAWFVSFAPAENPQIALAVIVENGGHGGSTAAPISKRIMEVFFRKLGLLKEEAPTSDSATPAVEQVLPEGETEEREGLYFTEEPEVPESE